jgi:hypothetical protein
MARRGTSGTTKPQEQPGSVSQIGAAAGTENRENPQRHGNGHGNGGGGEGQISFSSEEIAERAYQIYEREGRTDGRDMEHWLQAERELREERERSNSPQESRGVTETAERTGNRAPRPDEAPRSARRHQTAMS